MAEPMGNGWPIVIVQHGDSPEDVIYWADAIDAIETDGDQELYVVQLPDATREVRLSEVDLRNVMFNL